jgi:antitoxin PrlF
MQLQKVHYPGNVDCMAIAQSKVTAQGQISVPAEVRKKLGVGPGSVLEWDEQDDQVVVRRAGRYTSEDVHRVLFPEGDPKKGPLDVKDGIRKYIRKRHARG